MNKGQILKGFGRLMRSRDAAASFNLGLLILRLICLSSYSRRRKSKWSGEQTPSINMRGRKPFPKGKQGKLLFK